MIPEEHFKTFIMSTGIPIEAMAQTRPWLDYTTTSDYEFTPPQQHFKVSSYMNSLVQQYLHTTTFHRMLHELGYMKDDKMRTCPFCNHSTFRYEFDPNEDETSPDATTCMKTFCYNCRVLLHHQSRSYETSDSHSDFFSGYLQLISHDFGSASHNNRNLVQFKLGFIRAYAEMQRKVGISYPSPQFEDMISFSFYRDIAKHVYREPLQKLNDSLISLRRGEL